MPRCKNNRCGIRRKMAGSRRPTGNHAPQAADLSQVAAGFRLSTGESLAEAAEAGPIALVFLRHFGCTFTRQILRGLESLQDAAGRHHATLVLVHMLKSGEELRYLRGHDDVARIADPHCELYRAFGLGRGGILALFGPRVWWLGFISIFKGCGVGHLAGDGLQMPGAFLFHQGKITAAQHAASAADLPDLPLLFHTLQAPATTP